MNETVQLRAARPAGCTVFFPPGIKSPAVLVIRRPKLYYFTDAKMITARNTDRVRKDFIIFVHP